MSNPPEPTDVWDLLDGLHDRRYNVQPGTPGAQFIDDFCAGKYDYWLAHGGPLIPDADHPALHPAKATRTRRPTYLVVLPPSPVRVASGDPDPSSTRLDET